jgi:hypothetical protein
MFDPEFFLTPTAIAARMLAKISEDARHFLEPSGGKGDIADYITKDPISVGIGRSRETSSNAGNCMSSLAAPLIERRLARSAKVHK